MANIRKSRPRWERMDKNHIPIPSLVEPYLITCRTEGKTPATLPGYQEKLRGCLDINTDTGCRDSAMLMLFLDTGLRCVALGT